MGENPSPPESSSAQVIHSQPLLEETSNGDPVIAIKTESSVIESTSITLQLPAAEPSVTEESEQPVEALVSAIESLEIHTEEMVEGQESVIALEEPANQATEEVTVDALVEAVAEEPVVVAEDALEEAPTSEEPCADAVDGPASEEPSADVTVPASEEPCVDVPVEEQCADVPVLASEEPCADVVAEPASEVPCADVLASEEPCADVAVTASE